MTRTTRTRTTTKVQIISTFYLGFNIISWRIIDSLMSIQLVKYLFSISMGIYTRKSCNYRINIVLHTEARETGHEH